MFIQNLLEKQGQQYKAGNIKLVKILPLVVEVHKRDGEVLKYRKVEIEKGV